MTYSVNDSIWWTAARGFAIGIGLWIGGMALAAMVSAPLWLGAMVR